MYKFFFIKYRFLWFFLVFFFAPQVKGQESQFCYNFQTEIACNHDLGFALPSQIEAFAKKQNNYLNKSIFFDTSFILDTQRVRAYHQKQKSARGQVGHFINVTTQDGMTISCTYFDRGSDKLLIVGEGFTNTREKMTPFVDMFDCDVVLFDFRGHGYMKFDLFNPRNWLNALIQKIIGFSIDTDAVWLGLHEEKDVFAVVNFFKNHKKYTEINGLGLCYSALVFLKALALQPGLFNKIILDGCWLSLPLFVDKIKKDLKLIFSPQTGGWSKQWPFCNQGFMEILELFVEKLFGLHYTHNLSIVDYLAAIKDTPLLFFYGKDDLVVYRNEFETIWNGLQISEKTAIITSNPHVRNHLKQKELYKLVCDLFLELDQKTFIKCLRNYDTLVNHYVNKILDLKSTIKKF